MKALQHWSPLHPIGFDHLRDNSTPVALTICRAVIGNRLPRGRKFRKAQALMDSMRNHIIGSHPQVLHYFDDCFVYYMALIEGKAPWIVDEEERNAELEKFADYITLGKDGLPVFDFQACGSFLSKKFAFGGDCGVIYSELRSLVMK